QPLKWEARHTRETLGIYFALLRRIGEQHPALIVWPETAAPTILTRDPALVERFRAASAELGVPMLLGSIDAVDGGFRNTAFLITDQGIVDRYDKIHLVPFGEFVPLSGVLRFVRRWAQFIAELEAGTRAHVFNAPPAPFGVVICYEGIFPDLFRQFVRDGALLMVNMTNDAWFGRTSGPVQHLAMYPFRAVEHRVSIVRAANTGVSAFIAPGGARRRDGVARLLGRQPPRARADPRARRAGAPGGAGDRARRPGLGSRRPAGAGGRGGRRQRRRRDPRGDRQAAARARRVRAEGDALGPSRREGGHPLHPSGRGLHRVAGLGADAHAPVPPLVRARGLQGGGRGPAAGRRGGHQVRHHRGDRRLRLRLSQG